MGHHLIIPDDPITVCDSCNESYYTSEQSKEADRRLVDARRHAERLMNGEEIKALRQSFSLSQAQFESILGIGPKTVVRWENSTAVQSKAIDNVFNMLKYDPLSIVLLARLREHSTPFDVETAPQFQKQRGDLEQAIYAQIEATSAVQQECVKEVTLAVMAAFRSYKEKKMAQLIDERLATA
jgi:HTH-type transcriptional regulator/antitoxin MqsA